MDFDKNNISKIIIIGKQKDSIGGNKLIAKVILNTSEIFYTFLIPPLYLITEEVPEYILDSAIAKHGYKILNNEVVINNIDEFQKFISDLDKEN